MRFRTLNVLLGAAALLASCDRSWKAPDAPASTNVQQEGSQPGVVFAAIDVKCKGGGTYTISTGTDKGSCTTVTKEGAVVGGYCKDETNGSTMLCTTGCKYSSGAGSCKVKS
jgi:hypothetical protein